MIDVLVRRLRPFTRRMVGFLARFVRPVTLGVRVLVRDEAGRILLVRHSYLPGWYLPGGGVDPGESIGNAALRELREEGGLIGEGLKLFAIYHNLCTSKRDHVAFYFVERFVAAETGWQPSAEIREVGFFAPDALPPDTSPATLRRLREVFEGLEPSEKW
jgi:ADP-ribose pyrophosphatase YjhB (NUDIX family)